MDRSLLRVSVLYSIAICIPNVQMLGTQRIFFSLFIQLAVASNLYWTFSLSKLTPLSHPKNALVFLSAQGWGARFFLIESISSAATLWSCSKWKATEICRGGICQCRHCRGQCKIFVSGVNFSMFTHFFVFSSLKLLKLGEIGGVKFLAWKSGGVKFLTNSMSGNMIFECWMAPKMTLKLFKAGWV